MPAVRIYEYTCLMDQEQKDKICFLNHSSLRGLELLICSDISYCLPPHFNIDYCVWMDSVCMEKYVCKGNSYTLRPGEFSIIEPGDVHSNSMIESESRCLLTVYLSSEMLQKTAYQIDENAPETRLASDVHCDSYAVRGLSELYRVMQGESPSLEAGSLYVSFVSALIKRYGTSRLRESEMTGEERRVSRVKEMLNELYGEDISLDFLAENAGCTPYHLIRFFSRDVGMTPYAYLLHLRVERARQMIREGRKLAETAADTGFADQSHMSRHFKARYGITPGMYKKLTA